MAPMKYIPKFNSPNGKGLVYEGFFFEEVMVMLKDTKYIIKDTV